MKKQIPEDSALAYQKEWISWGDLFGIDTKRTPERNYVVVPLYYNPKRMPNFEGDWFSTKKEIREFGFPESHIVIKGKGIFLIYKHLMNTRRYKNLQNVLKEENHRKKQLEKEN